MQHPFALYRLSDGAIVQHGHMQADALAAHPLPPGCALLPAAPRVDDWGAVLDRVDVTATPPTLVPLGA